ncbi:MAG: ScpA family protein [Candidatus Hydrothermarchaeota archaeon]|nr:ScpA family protein [Candidatus Hydrothermarchaeota archaeon]
MHPIEMLVDLVISEEMDLWQIDIAEIANRFLQKVREMATINLRLSGKTLLTAAILLRMKSESLVPREEPQSTIDDFFIGSYADYEETSEAMLQLPMRRQVERNVTLFELVEALQRALSEEMLRKNFPRQVRQPQKLVIQIDEESIKEKIANVLERIQNLAKVHEVIKFSELLTERTRRSIVEVLLCLLYLDSQQKVTLWQKELFGEIFVTVR